MKNKIYFLLLTLTPAIFQTATAQTYPPGFSQGAVTTSLNKPTNMGFAPDGRIFICQQGGKLRVIKNGVLLDRPFITLLVDSSGERGLLGVAFDPGFTSNHLVYLYYTLQNGSNNRIIRVKAKNDTANTSTIQTVLDLDPLSGATNHNGGSIKFGKDGKLYVAVGENANGANAQNLDTYLGKLLRINSNGSIPTGNPYTTGTEQKKRIWCYGLRNPFSFDIEPATGRIFVDDVGQNTWEEINDATVSNKNFGWPDAEGISTNPDFTNPVFTYNHTGKADRTGCAITGGTFFSPLSTNYPAKFAGNYFFLDLCGNWINRLILNDTSRRIFATNIAGSNVGLTTGPDGNLYFLSRDNGALYKIVYTSGLQENSDKIADQQVKELFLYPSPANTSITIDTRNFNANNLFVKIFDAKGALIKDLQTTGMKTTINTSSFANGFYFILINDVINVRKIKFEVIH